MRAGTTIAMDDALFGDPAFSDSIPPPRRANLRADGEGGGGGGVGGEVEGRLASRAEGRLGVGAGYLGDNLRE